MTLEDFDDIMYYVRYEGRTATEIPEDIFYHYLNSGLILRRWESKFAITSKEFVEYDDDSNVDLHYHFYKENSKGMIKYYASFKPLEN